MTAIVRQATRDDITEISALIPESVRALSAAYYSEAQIEAALMYVFGVDTQLIEDGTYYVAEAEGRTVGCGGWSRRRTLFGGDQAKAGATDSPLDPTRDAARIRAFYIHPAWARRGIGRSILSVCEQAARRANFTRVELVATLPGEPLYAALGYREIERIEIDLHSAGTLPAVRMGKELDP